MSNVKEVLQLSFLRFRKKGVVYPFKEDAIFDCIGLLAAAVGPNLTKWLCGQLGFMFRNGLCESLTLVTPSDPSIPSLQHLQCKSTTPSIPASLISSVEAHSPALGGMPTDSWDKLCSDAQGLCAPGQASNLQQTGSTWGANLYNKL